VGGGVGVFLVPYVHKRDKLSRGRAGVLVSSRGLLRCVRTLRYKSLAVAELGGGGGHRVSSQGRLRRVRGRQQT